MGPALFTIGYQQAAQGDLITLLKEHDIALLADIRARAQSRKPGFSKSNLAASVEEAGIAYRHFPAVGTPPEGRAAARAGDRETLRQVYAGQLELPEALAAMAELRALALEQRTCLLCYCRDASKCHRHLLVKEIFEDFAVTDLVPGLAR